MAKSPKRHRIEKDMLKGFNKKLLWAVLFLILGSALFCTCFFLKKTPELIETPESETIKIILVGDIMLDRGVEYIIAKEGNNDFVFPFAKIAEYFQQADIVFGNLEGPISDKGTKVGSIYSFRADPQAIEGLKYANFNILSLANNHAFDYARSALEDTFLRLRMANINYSGAGFSESEAYSPIIKEIKGIKIGFLSYANLGPEFWRAQGNNSGIAWVSESDFERIREDIKLAKEQVDILIISLHAGEEYIEEPTQFQKDFAQLAIAAGADLFIGHHPHIVQRNENKTFYSLGNFIFDQGFSTSTMEGQIVEVLIENGRIKKVSPKKIKISEFFQPEIKNE